jgi:hypothetical protein
MRISGRVRLKEDGRKGEIIEHSPEVYWDRGVRRHRHWLILQMDDGSRAVKLLRQLELIEEPEGIPPGRGGYYPE